MKKSNIFKTIAAFAIFAISTTSTNAQTLELTVSGGYQFGSRVNYGFNNYTKFKEGNQFGITAGIDMFEGTTGELTYIHNSSEILLSDVNYADIDKVADTNADWIFLGGSKYFEYDNFRPFIGAGFGLAIFSFSNEHEEVGNINTALYFAGMGKAGLNYMITDALGLNVQANLMIPVQYGGFYVGIGGAGINARSTILVGGFSGGLVYRFL